MPDERSSEVISEVDPYHEMELYLKKVSDEIGEVFEKWLTEPKISTLPRSHRVSALTSKQPPIPPIRTKRSRLLHHGQPTSKRRPKTPEWTENTMADFDILIAKELLQLEREAATVNAMVNLVTRTDRRSSDSEIVYRPEDGLSSGFNTMESSDFESVWVTVGTQTSPALSRSSSFTWMSDCSSYILNTDDKSSSSEQSSSPSSMTKHDCGNFDSLDSSPDSSGVPSCLTDRLKNKEPWERFRHRPLQTHSTTEDGKEIWIRRESVHTQTVDSVGLDECSPDTEEDVYEKVTGLPPIRRPKGCGSLPRPNHLPLSSVKMGQEFLSPESASLCDAQPHTPDLYNKSSSAPVIAKKPPNTEEAAKQSRSQSLRQLAEIEAAESCKWLRAAGFPQYAQMFEDLQFPIDVSAVQKDHPFLDKDSIQSLFRRLHALNRCAKMKIDNASKTAQEDSEDDEQCALSENWTFEPESRRWSRVCEVAAEHLERLHSAAGTNNNIDVENISMDKFRYGSLPQGMIGPDSEMLAARFRRTGSERLRDSAKAFLRRMESIKTRKRKKQHREVTISGPQVLDVLSMQQKVRDLQCIDVSPTGSPPPFGDDNSSYCSDNSNSTPVHGKPRSKLQRARKFFQSPQRKDDGAFSDSEIQPTNWRHYLMKDANCNNTKLVEILQGESRGPLDEEPPQLPGSSRSLPRGGSFNLGRENQRIRSSLLLRNDFEYADKSGSSELTEDSSSTLASQPDSDQDSSSRPKASVVRWHSFQRGEIVLNQDCGTSIRAMSALSCGQLLVLRKYALLKLTACMEKYCPTHRTGWNWELPKFIRKIKAPDYKDKTVFGVPLLLSQQRSGQALPNSIQIALRWLRTNALDQVGLFRKSGVRSRIHSLKLLTENQSEGITYDGQQAYDVADMVKQYLRELPEALVTNKLSDTFISIFQYVPACYHRDAVQWVLLLLPDEHREALQTVLEFLHNVSLRSQCNQMTASNLAVCLAPSLFHLHRPPPSPQGRSSSASPRRRNKTVGVPDQKELGENKAAHDCLLFLIRNYREAFIVSDDMFSNCRFSSLEASVPMTLDELGTEMGGGWQDYLKHSTKGFLKELRDKSRGWISTACSPDLGCIIEMAYKKVGDGHPLRLWRVSTEVEAPPQEVLHRVLRERHVWDASLLKWRVVKRLDANAEIFQFVCASMPPLPAKDYCVLRSWRSESESKGGWVVVETSVENAEAEVFSSGIRGVVLASRYLIEHCGSGRSRIIHVSRVDTKGRSPEWYNKSYGHICAMQLAKIRNSFQHNTTGPESKV